MKMQGARLLTLDFWKAYWVTMRPYLLFVSGVAGMAGFADGQERGVGLVVVIFLVFFLSYGFGQALTDCFQMDTDSISSPYRPLVKGVISRNQVLLVSVIGLVSGCAVFFIVNPWSLIPGILAVIGLATYTYFKRTWWGGPFYNAWIVAFLPLIGKMAASGPSFDFISFFKSGLLVPIMLSVFFSYANFVLMGYFKDISADRESGYETFVVAFGWKKAAIGSDALALLSLFASGWGIFIGLSSERILYLRWFSLPIYMAAAVFLVFAQIGIHRTRDEKKAYRPIENIVRSFILLHLAEVCVLRPSWIPAAVVFYAGFEWILKVRPEKEQV